MKKYLIAAVAAIVIVALVLWFLFRSNGNKCISVIPEDAITVVELRADELVRELDINLTDILFFADSSREDYGIDNVHPMYCFVDKDGTTGLVVALGSEDSFSAALEQKGFTLTERQGFHWAQNGGLAGGIIICYDDDRALIVGPAVTADERTLSRIRELMTQGKHEVQRLNSLSGIEGFIRLSTSMDMLPESARQMVVGKLQQGTDLSAIDIHSGLSIEGTAIRLSMSVSSPDPEIEKQLNEVGKILDNLDGSLLGFTTENPLFWLSGSINGDDLLEQLRKLPEIRTALIGLNMIIDADMIICAIDGNISLTIPYYNAKGSPALFLAELDNKDFLKKVPDWGNSLVEDKTAQFKAISGTDFSIGFNGSTIYFGVSDNKLYISNVEKSYFSSCLEGNSTIFQPLKKDICAQNLYASLNMGTLVQQFSPVLSLMGRNLKLIDNVKKVDRFNVKMNQNRVVTFELTAKEDIKEILKSMLK